EHDERQTERMEFVHGFTCGGLNRIGNSKDTRGLAIHRNIHRGLAILLKFDGRGFEFFQTRYLFMLEEGGFANHHSATCDNANDPTSSHRTKVCYGLNCETPILRALNNCGGKRVFAALLQRTGERQQRIRVYTSSRMDVDQLWFSFRERSCLV